VVAALNPWDRLGLDLELHVPGTLRFVGENIQVTPGAPLGLDDFAVFFSLNLKTIRESYGEEIRVPPRPNADEGFEWDFPRSRFPR
jgi:hypothetical protein